MLNDVVVARYDGSFFVVCNYVARQLVACFPMEAGLNDCCPKRSMTKLPEASVAL